MTHLSLNFSTNGLIKNTFHWGMGKRSHTLVRNYGNTPVPKTKVKEEPFLLRLLESEKLLEQTTSVFSLLQLLLSYFFHM